MAFYVNYIGIGILCLCSYLCGVVCQDERHRLLKNLLDERAYRKRFIPLKDGFNPIIVTVDIDLNHIRNLDELAEELTLLAWLRLEWNDEFLTWNESEFGGIKKIHLPRSTIWIPDIVLYNSIDDEKTALDLMPDSRGQIQSDGHVLWDGLSLMKVSCNVSTVDFPFDTQRCQLVLGSWTYNAKEVVVKPRKSTAGFKDSIPLGEWDIIGVPCIAQQKLFVCCPEPYAEVICDVIISRKPRFYMYNFTLPSSLLAVTGILVFVLSSENRSKVNICLTLLLAISVYQVTIMDSMPRSMEDASLLNKYLSSCRVWLAISTLFAVLLQNWHAKGSSDVRPHPWYRQFVIGKLAKLTYLGHLEEELKKQFDTEDNEYYVEVDLPHEAPHPAPEPLLSDAEEVLKTTNAILQEIKQQSKRNNKEKLVDEEWKAVARVMNRVFFVIYLTLLILTVIVSASQIPKRET